MRNALIAVSGGLTTFGILLACFSAPLGNTTVPLLLVFLGGLMGVLARPRSLPKRLEAAFPLPLLVLAAYIPVNAAFSVEPVISIASGIAYMLVVFSAFHGARRLKGSSERVRATARALFGVGSFLSVAYSLYSYHVLHLYRARAPFVGENALGTIDTVIISLGMGFILTKGTSRVGKAAWGILTLLATYSLFISQSRGAYVGLVISLMVFALFGREGRITLAGGAVVGAAIMRFVPSVWARVSSITNLGAIGDRIPAWKSTLIMVKDHPIMGIGLGTFIHVYPSYRLPESHEEFLSYAHNIFLQVWVELGSIGLLVYLWLLCSVFAKALGKESGWVSRALLLAIIGVLAHDLFDCITYGLEIGGLFWILMGLAWVKTEPRSTTQGS